MTDSSPTATQTPRTGKPGPFNRIRSFFREAAPSIKQQRIIALILLICQGGITVSGSIVRVTGSGLGCETWPNCHAGSLVPVPGAAPWIHQVIEFGNRLLTFVVAAAAIAAIVAMHMAKRRFELKLYAWLSIAGIAVQAVLGAISVFMDLHWWAVAIHFIPSMILVWIAAMLYSRIKEADDGTRTPELSDAIRYLAIAAVVGLSVVLMTGTMVTGSGVHAGDAGVGMEGRLDIDTKLMAYIHAGCMYVYVLFTVIVQVLLYRKNASDAAKKAGWVLIACIIIQWAIGVFQFYMGVPRWTIPFHIGMSSVVTAYTALLYAHGIVRAGGTSGLETGSPAGDVKREKRQKALAAR
ncbi:COX15/CtaA family protein [Corynebacterium ammoniagenes]|uniref:Cytochrome oxidase assembly protein n=1 Tax=Corynebacterium ammoniagenes DSM 20306 TaxID=649754 RepID=A0ABN0AHQ9_CORAM|nr:heme A synthase [Corynebacterium ammoniagenes]AQS73740.1 heme A synthase [Corynebacterium ammoniagenes]EFG82413.1 cytochrome oxidase assembly protein [Corynebacterium ammoniagenes DSM 20306]NMF30712.1 heme A synthase [Corynebacterium ammoniagenes]